MAKPTTQVKEFSRKVTLNLGEYAANTLTGAEDQKAATKLVKQAKSWAARKGYRVEEVAIGNLTKTEKDVRRGKEITYRITATCTLKPKN